MTTNVSSSSRSGVGLFGLTFVALLVLKLTGLAHLSWFWVFAPLIAAVGLGVIFFVVAFLILVFVS